MLLKQGDKWHHLVLTDFGCCLAEDGIDLKVPYFTDETNKGGNGSLMAPEVIYQLFLAVLFCSKLNLVRGTP